MKRTIAVFCILILLFFVSCERNDMYEFASSSTEYNGPHFVAVGDSGKIYYSYNGQVWIEALSPTANTLYGITVGDKEFVAVGLSGTVVISTDGINWNTITISGAAPVYCIAYGNGTYVGAGSWFSMTQHFWSSTDPAAWNDHSFAQVSGNQMNGIAFGNGRFYSLGNNYSGWYSDDNGATWTASNQIGSNYWGVVYANSKFTAVGAGGMIRESADAGTGTWVNANGGTFPGQILAVTYGNGKYIVVGSSGDSAWSLTGTTWTNVNTGTANGLNSVTYGMGMYVAAGDAGTVVYSVDGLSWTAINISSANLRSVAYRE